MTLAWYDGLLAAPKAPRPPARALPGLAAALAERENDR
jgi:hypothetical protein